MSQRLVYRRHNNYKTRSNKTKVVKTPGGKLTLHVISKASKGPRCGDCKTRLHGIPCLRPFEYKGLARSKRTVSRAYGGSRCLSCLKNRILRAVLVEEAKVFKKLGTSAKKSIGEEKTEAPVATKQTKTDAKPKTESKPKTDTKAKTETKSKAK